MPVKLFYYNWKHNTILFFTKITSYSPESNYCYSEGNMCTLVRYKEPKTYPT